MTDKTILTPTRREILKYGVAASAVGATGLLGGPALAQSEEFERFVVAMWSGMPNIDPEQNNIRTCLIVMNWLFDPLVWRDKDTNALKPYLAESYEFMKGNVWRFHLRQGATFHNGRKLDAHAVKFSMERRQSEAIGSPFRKSFTDVLETKVVDDHTVDFVCATPFPMLPNYLPTFSIMEPGFYTEHGKQETALESMGSGPFRLVEFKPDDILRAERNDDYWGEQPVIRKAEAPVILEDATRVASLLAGDLHIAPRPVMEDFDRIEASGITRVTASGGNRIVLAGLNYDMEPFGDRRVRQAVNYAVDSALLNEVYLRDTGEIMASALPSTVPGHDPSIEPYPYDPAMAKELLKEAGFANGFKTTIEVNPGWLIAGTEVTQAIANFLGEVGIEAELRFTDAGTLATAITQRKAGPIYMLSWGGNSTFDADSYVGTLMDEGAYSCNRMPEVGKLVKAGRETADPAERVAIYQEACRIIHEEAPWIFMYLQPNTYGASTNHDWMARADEMIPLWYTKRTA